MNSVGGRLQSMTGDINTFVTDFADVQQQLDELLTENRSNIDFDLQALNSVSGTLSADRKHLATTLCSLPSGVAPYFQTTSWGEWFNVRIVEFTFKDQNSQTVTSAQELGEGRSPHDPNPVYRCPGSPSIPTGGKSEAGPLTVPRGPSSAGTNGSGASGGATSGSGGFQGLQTYVDSLMGRLSQGGRHG